MATVFDTREFEEEFIAHSFKPLTSAERARWQRVRRKAAAKAARSGLVAKNAKKSNANKNWKG